MKIYITRHGETDRNAVNRVLGRTDLPLNAKGLAQADQLAEDLKDIHFDCIYTSPLQRAKTTACKVQQGRDCEVRDEMALIEQNFGIYEGVPRDDETYQKEKHMFFKPFPQGESFLDVSARVYPFLEQVIEEWKDKPDASILLVCHGGICRMIHNYFEGMDNEDFASYFMVNCGVESFEIQDVDTTPRTFVIPESEAAEQQVG